MKRSHIFTSLACAWAAGLTTQAQEVTQETIDLEERRRSVANLEVHLTDRQQRLAELAEDIITLDERVERRIDRIVKVLAESTDSGETGTKVAQTKERAIQGLKNAIDLYVKERAKVREQLRTGSAAAGAEALEKDVSAFDARIEKRVDQIIDLTNSLSADKGYQKYNVTYRERRFGREEKDIRINEKWRHNHRENIRTAQQRKEIEQALAKNIEDLKRRQEYLTGKLGETRITASERSFYQIDLDRVKATIAARQEQLDEVQELEGVQAPTEEVDSKMAYRMAESLEDHGADLRDDVYTIFRKYQDYSRLRDQVAKMEKNLAARKEWLEKNAQ